MVTKFGFEFGGKKFNIDVKICKSILLKASGLMFKKDSMSLLFVFKTSRKRAIHSYFCQPFLAIWFNNDEIVDVRLIKKWKANIKPKKGFNKLLEIPSSDNYFNEVCRRYRNL